MDQTFDEIADGEVRRVALPAVAELLAEPEGVEVGGLQRLHAIAHAREPGGDEHVVRDGQAAVQNRRRLALRATEVLRIRIVPYERSAYHVPFRAKMRPMPRMPPFFTRASVVLLRSRARHLTGHS